MLKFLEFQILWFENYVNFYLFIHIWHLNNTMISRAIIQAVFFRQKLSKMVIVSPDAFLFNHGKADSTIIFSCPFRHGPVCPSFQYLTSLLWGFCFKSNERNAQDQWFLLFLFDCERGSCSPRNSFSFIQCCFEI